MFTNKTLKKQILDAVMATEPVAARCPHVVECGGCAFQDRAYAAQLAVKAAALDQLWAEGLPGLVHAPIPVVASPDTFGYRTRMDYVSSRDRFGLRRRGKFNYIVDLYECHLIPPAAFVAARTVYERAIALGLTDYNLHSHEGFMRYFVVRVSPQGALMLALVTASRAYDGELAQLAELALSLDDVASFYWLLNDKVTDTSIGEPVRFWGAEYLPMQVGARTLAIGPNTFFQNNVHLLLPMLDEIAAATVALGDARSLRVADLYGGVGTIALHLADQVREVVCVEEVGESVVLAQANIVHNRVANVAALASDTLAYVRSQSPEAFDVIVVDPPRIGLGPEVSRELRWLGPRRIIYVSCNPITQIDDVRTLLESYDLVSLRGYDMFPHTPHLETLAVFDRRAGV